LEVVNSGKMRLHIILQDLYLLELATFMFNFRIKQLPSNLKIISPIIILDPAAAAGSNMEAKGTCPCIAFMTLQTKNKLFFSFYLIFCLSNYKVNINEPKSQ